MPALVIIVDEYAELADDAPDAVKHADSVARRGRAVAVNLIAATQRPTQKAMGQGAVRSQMDIRICFRVRERKDVDLILGQGMLTAGWNAHTLNAPGKFLISAAEHDTPRRARAYLVTDEAVADTASRYADFRPPLDEVSRRAIEEQHATEPPDESSPRTETGNGTPGHSGRGPVGCSVTRSGRWDHGARSHGRYRHEPPVDLPPAARIGRARSGDPGQLRTLARRDG